LPGAALVLGHGGVVAGLDPDASSWAIAQAGGGTPPSCGRLLLPALVLATEPAAASDAPVPAVGEEHVPREEQDDTCLRARAGICPLTSDLPGASHARVGANAVGPMRSSDESSACCWICLTAAASAEVVPTVPFRSDSAPSARANRSARTLRCQRQEPSACAPRGRRPDTGRPRQRPVLHPARTG
jgi:hypothetical protein